VLADVSETMIPTKQMSVDDERYPQAFWSAEQRPYRPRTTFHVDGGGGTPAIMGVELSADTQIYVESVFSVLDRDQNGQISAKDFVGDGFVPHGYTSRHFNESKKAWDRLTDVFKHDKSAVLTPLIFVNALKATAGEMAVPARARPEGRLIDLWTEMNVIANQNVKYLLDCLLAAIVVFDRDDVMRYLQKIWDALDRQKLGYIDRSQVGRQAFGGPQAA
jgi:hypothetical protein